MPTPSLRRPRRSRARSGSSSTWHACASWAWSTAAGGRTTLLEDFRIIKRPLLQRALQRARPDRKPGNLIMITSSLPGEGKTFCAINLAMSIAMELDHTVLLIDADVARPSVLRTLGLPAQRGLMDMLLDDKLDLSRRHAAHQRRHPAASCPPAPARRTPPNCWPARR